MGCVYWSVEAGGTREARVANMLNRPNHRRKEFSPASEGSISFLWFSLMLIVKFSLLLLRCALPQWVACLGCSLWGGVTMASVIAFNTILVSQLQVRQLDYDSS